MIQRRRIKGKQKTKQNKKIFIKNCFIKFKHRKGKEELLYWCTFLTGRSEKKGARLKIKRNLKKTQNKNNFKLKKNKEDESKTIIIKCHEK